MSTLSRFAAVFGLDFRYTLKRPMFWSLLAVLTLLAWGMSTGNVSISSGDTTVGGRRAWITSEFSVAFIMTVMIPSIAGFFTAIAAGLSIIQDSEHRVGEILLSTRLKAKEYVWGKALAVAAAYTLSVVILALLMIFFNHAIPRPGAEEIYGPLELANYFRPAFVFGLPAIFFLAGVPFYLGERTRRPLAAFLFPIAVVLGCFFFLWNWNPSWLDPKINRLLMLVDPGGVRWLQETWLKQDLGADFYNTAVIGFDLPFILSRLAFFGIGVAGFVLAARHLEANLRSQAEAGKKKMRLWGRRPKEETFATTAPATAAPRSPLVMTASPPGFLQGTWIFAKEELGRLVREPAIYLFAFFILLQALGNALVQIGAFQTRLLLTPGILASSTMGILAFMTCLLLMFFTAEALQRDHSTGTAALIYSSPVRGFSLLLGRALGNGLLAVIMLGAVFLGCLIALLIQGTVPLSLTPFFLVWGLLLVPTFLLWTSFVTAVQAITGNRFATYGISLGVFGFTVYKLIVGELTWLTNWPLWGTLQWSDMSVLELDRQAFLLNRLFALSLAGFFLAVAVRFFQRRTFDATRILHRLRPKALRATAGFLAPWAALPLILGITLYLSVANGTGGKAAEKEQKDYWKQNLATWKDFRNPALTAVEVDLDLEPDERRLESRGTYRIVNDRGEDLRRFALTGGLHWRDIQWTLDGEPYEPENRSHLYVFTPDPPLPPGGAVEVGFSFHGRYPDGISKNGGGAGQFVLPSGVVLNSFTSSFVPVLGYVDQIGIDDDNRYEPKVWEDDFFEAELHPFTGTVSPFTTKVTVTGPEDFTLNSVGVLESETVQDGRRTVVWKSDHPVRFFNVVGGRYAVKEGSKTKIFYHPRHGYNVDEMSRVLEAAREHYSRWFYPYPWQELKISEFPALAGYAQGFATNIPFSESIGFLTRSDAKTDAVTLVTAHEAAHQWWANILTPGEGPGGNLLSEGMSHFATMLLMEEIKGPQGRMEFSKRIEERYGDTRRRDAEQPLVKTDGSRPGDNTVTYDKGGWVFWMTLRHLGRETALEAIRAFIDTYKDGPDYPVLQDFTAALRPYAADPEAFDAFVEQWYHEVVLPELKLTEPAAEQSGAGWRVTVEVEQAGTGRVPVEIAATAGERFLEDGEPNPEYREARTVVELTAGEVRTVEIATDFEPEAIIADPDVHLLQLRRNRARAEL